MRRLIPCLVLTLSFLGALAAVFAPRAAHAADLVVAGEEPRKPDDERKGVYMGAGVSPGTAIIAGGFIPTTRISYFIGGGITDRFTLGLDVGGTGYFGHNKFGFSGDIVGTGFIARGLYMRAAVGVASAAPARAERTFRPGLGGYAGIGYEFRVLKRVGIALGVDYDARVRVDGRYAQAIVVGLGMRVYLSKRHRR